LRPRRTSWHLARHRSWDLEPFAALLRSHGCECLWAFAHPPAVCRHGPVAGSGVRFFGPAITSSKGHFLQRSGGDWLLGFGPVNQPCLVNRRPRYSFGSNGPRDHQGHCCLGFWASSLRSTDTISEPAGPVLIACRRIGQASVSLEPAFRRPSLPGRHFWRLSARALFGFPHQPVTGKLM